MKIKNLFIAFSVVAIVSGVILCFILSATSADERSDSAEKGQLVAQAKPDMNVPPMLQKRLEKLGVSIEDFQNDPEKRAKVSELMKKAEEARQASPKGEKEGDSKKSQKSDKKRGGESYYKEIMDKNLFRPLGWGPKAPENPFALRATMPSPNIPSESKAIIWVREGNKERTVTIGDDINGAIVKTITNDSVTMEKDGKLDELNTGGLVFLGGSSGGGGKGRGGGGKQPQVTHTGKQPNKNVQHKINQMSPEQRRKVAEETRRRGGGGRSMRSGRRGGQSGGGRSMRSGERMRRR